MEGYNYTVAFERDDRAANWNVEITPASGRKALGQGDPVVRLVATGNVAAGTYTGVLRVRMAGAETVEELVPVVLDVPASTAGEVFELSRTQVAAVVGARTGPVVTLTNVGTVRRQFRLLLRGTAIGERLTLDAGQAGNWNVGIGEARGGPVAEAMDVEYCTVGPAGCPNPVVVRGALLRHTMGARVGAVRGARCEATRLIPVVLKTPARRRAGLPWHVDVEVWDDCGTRREEWEAMLEEGGEVVGGGASGMAIRHDGKWPPKGLGGMRVVVTGTDGVRGAGSVVMGSGEAGRMPRVDGVEGSAGDQLMVYGAFAVREAIVASREVTDLGGFRVLLDGEALPLAAVAPGYIAARAPARGRTGRVVVTNGAGVASAPVEVSIAAARPEVLEERGVAAVYRVVGGAAPQLVTKENPVRAGDTLMVRATGVGSDARQVKLVAGKTVVDAQRVNKVCCWPPRSGVEYSEVTFAARSWVKGAYTVQVGESKSGSFGVAGTEAGTATEVALETWSNLMPYFSTSMDVGDGSGALVLDGYFAVHTVKVGNTVTLTDQGPHDMGNGVRRVPVQWDLFENDNGFAGGVLETRKVERAAVMGPVSGEQAAPMVGPVQPVQFVIPANAHSLMLTTVEEYKLKWSASGNPGCVLKLEVTYPDGTGAVFSGEGEVYLPEGTKVVFSPAEGNAASCTFSGLTANGVASGTTVTMDGAKVVVGQFGGCYLLAVQTTPAGVGTAYAVPSQDGTTCYAAGSTAQLVASSGGMEEFLQWTSNDVAVSGSSVVMDKPATVTAEFCPFTWVEVRGPAGVRVQLNGGSNAGGFDLVLPGAIPVCAIKYSPMQVTVVDAVVSVGTGTRMVWNGGMSVIGGTQHPPDGVALGGGLTVVELPYATQHRLQVTVTPSAGAGTVAVNGCQLEGAVYWCNDGGTVTLTATASTGSAFDSYVAGGTANPLSFVMTGPRNVEARFTGLGLTVETAPAGLRVRIGTGSYAAAPVTQTVTAGQTYTVSAEQPQIVGDTGYNFQQWSTGAGTPSIQVTPTVQTTVTASFVVACYVLTVNVTGPGTVSHNGTVAAGFPAGSNCLTPGTVVTLTATANAGATVSGWSGAASGAGTTVTVTMSGPRAVGVEFVAAAGSTMTIRTVPGGMGLTIDGQQAVSPATRQWNAGTSHTLLASSPQQLGQTFYKFLDWTANPNVAGFGGANAIQLVTAPAAATTFSANFDVLCQLVSAQTAGGEGGSVTTELESGNPAGTPANCAPAQSQVTVLARAAAGYVFGGWTGAVITEANRLQNPLRLTVNGPVAVQATFSRASNVTLTVATNPAGLNVRIGTGGAFAAAPLTQQVQAGQTVTVATEGQQVRNGVGYRLTGWSNGATGVTTTVQVTGTETVTANFGTVCYVLTVNRTPAAGGTVGLNPAAGVEGMPAGCYAPGTVVTLTATAATGYQLVSWTGGTALGGAAANVRTVTMTSPQTVTANFGQPPVLNVTMTSRTGGNLSMNVGNTGGTAATNVRVLSITGITPAGIVYSPTVILQPPFVVPGAANLGAGGNSGFNLIFLANGSTNFTTPFSFTVTMAADNVAQFTRTINVP